ncbi:ParB N-terminal domain-containing protein [Mesorhizobium sp. AR07]|uniref:ParB/RepB/Spo0J family partition protein n=1 Tax=Mesorhizobium sp. AR07 TaxID=2865838 RepID=UPI00215FBEA0|nr:ParB N-terminal domain-containing protein [Mesorhizobium sp. AR07]UVK43278.1 ParB N-terminal domain-containing protein [Mesorhizobium sp. AR07]
MTAVKIPIEDIRRHPGARPLNDESLLGLADSIAEVGLINAIRVRRHGDGYQVIAGHHRFAACDSLGWTEIDATIVDDDDLHAELVMIDENLCRAELSPVDRAKQTARRKAIYIELHPETKHGGNLEGSGVANFATPEIPRFTAATATVTGQSERLVQLNAERGEKVIDEVVDLIRGTKLDTGSYLDRLKGLRPNEQVFAAKRDLAYERSKADQPRQGGIAGRYAAAASQMPTAAEIFDRFIKLVDEIEAFSIPDLITGADRKRAVLGQRASGLADRMSAIMEGLDQ